MFVSVIVLAAGKGTRFGSRIPKPFVPLCGRPVIEYCLRTFRSVAEIGQVVLAVSPSVRTQAHEALARTGWGGSSVVRGGARRQDSVNNCLKALDPRAGIVLIHDGVRPLVCAETVSAVIRKAAASGAAVCAVPAKATIKKVAGGLVKETLAREQLWEIQTPQGFRKEIILSAYRAAGDRDVTDDASLVESCGHPVHVVQGEYANLKITTPEDLVVAGALLTSQ